MSSAAPGNGRAPTWGDLVEKWACDEFDLIYEDESHYDATKPDGSRVEIKGARVWIQNGVKNGEQQWCRGRFKFWEESHAELQDDGDEDDEGEYLLVIYEEVSDDADEDAQINVLAYQWVKPATITEIAGGCWYDVRSNPRTRTKGDPYRLSWTKVIDPSEVDDGE